MIGDGPLRQQAEQLALKLDLADHIHFIDYQQEPLSYIAAMDIFLLTSQMEGLPNVLIEAQALGIPVVTTDAGGASETLIHGKTGWVCKKNNPKYIAKKIIQLLSSSWLENARKEGPQFVKDKFCLERMVRETLEIYADF